MGLNWEPSGHPTEGVYTIPHFDFHFYMISEEEVMNITGAPCRRLPGAMRLLPHASHRGAGGHRCLFRARGHLPTLADIALVSVSPEQGDRVGSWASRVGSAAAMVAARSGDMEYESNQAALPNNIDCVILLCVPPPLPCRRPMPRYGP